MFQSSKLLTVSSKPFGLCVHIEKVRKGEVIIFPFLLLEHTPFGLESYFMDSEALMQKCFLKKLAQHS